MSGKRNIFEIVNERQLNFIVSATIMEDTSHNYKLCEAAVFIHLFYLKGVDFYLNYIRNIPAGMDIFISVSTKEMKQEVEKYLTRWDILNCTIIMKENRGRDISALLIAFRKYIPKYTYVCFIHDKWAKNKASEEVTKRWIRNMWDNTLISTIYIQNVLNLMEKNETLGLLVPPEVAEIMSVYANSWEGNYSNTLELAKRLKLSCNILREFPPITHGTVFWCKSLVLESLMKIDWKYEDFQAEPLPNDYTLSHAVERIFGYAAQSAGYDTGYIMSDSFAKSYILQLKSELQKSVQKLESCIWRERAKNVLLFMKKYQNVYFYGAGKIGRKCYEAVISEIKPNGFIVSSKNENYEMYLGLPIYTIDEIIIDESVGIVITVGNDSVSDIIDILKKIGITNYMSYVEDNSAI